MMKRVLILAAILMTLFAMPGCMKNVDKRYKGLSIGFNFTGPKYYTIMNAVRSEKKEFAIDDVTVDLYTGWFGPDLSDIESDSTAIVAFYVVSYGAGLGRWYEPQVDYRNIENQYFLTEVPEKTFPRDFAASQTRKKGKVFTHSGIKITIPKEVLKLKQGYLDLYAEIVTFSEEDNLYHCGFANSGKLIIQYKFIDDNTVMLSRMT